LDLAVAMQTHKILEDVQNQQEYVGSVQPPTVVSAHKEAVEELQFVQLPLQRIAALLPPIFAQLKH
jgi:hypothetical protein